MTKRILTLLLALLLPGRGLRARGMDQPALDPTDRHGAVDCIFVLAYSHAESTGDKYAMQLEWAAVDGGEGGDSLRGRSVHGRAVPTSAISMSSGEKACTGR